MDECGDLFSGGGVVGEGERFRVELRVGVFGVVLVVELCGVDWVVGKDDIV